VWEVSYIRSAKGDQNPYIFVLLYKLLYRTELQLNQFSVPYWLHLALRIEIGVYPSRLSDEQRYSNAHIAERLEQFRPSQLADLSDLSNAAIQWL
jgi:hypothetical protein